MLAKPNPVAARRSLDDALGLVLAEDIASDVDSPPHDKSLVDGYAVVAADLADGTGRAGRPGRSHRRRRAHVEPSTAARDAHHDRRAAARRRRRGGDDRTIRAGRRRRSGTRAGAVCMPARVPSGQNIMRRAASMARGDVVLRSGCALRPDRNRRAGRGRPRARAASCPGRRVAVLSTGNELVPAEQTSRRPARFATATVRCWWPRRAPPARRPSTWASPATSLDRLRRADRARAGVDVLIISGGVSAGVLDLVPRVLDGAGRRAGVSQSEPQARQAAVVRRARARPAGDTLVFGLPGNPVSSLVCFELFVRPALGRLAGPRRRALVAVTADAGDPITRIAATGRPIIPRG